MYCNYIVMNRRSFCVYLTLPDGGGGKL